MKLYSVSKIKLIVGLFLLTGCISYGAVQTGSPAPEFTLTDTNGDSHQLSDFAGKFVVLEWSNHQCPFVRKHYDSGNMQSLQKEMTDAGAVWLQIVSSAEGKQGYLSPEEGNALYRKEKMNATAILLDESGEVGKLYDARTTPHMYLINPEGTLIYQGAIDSIRSARQSDIEEAKNYVKAAYQSALAGEPIEDATTKAYGCSIKY